MVKLFLAGDVMTGRGIDQILPCPASPEIFEEYLRSAEDYVRLAERVNGRIERPAEPAYVWGDALGELARQAPKARIVNLETSVTTSATPAPKAINYRMHPANIGVLTVADIDCCVLANNHVLDWEEAGLLDTLASLKRAGIAVAGAGRDLAEAASPAVIETGGGRRVLVFGLGVESSGIPKGWAAKPRRPGVRLLSDLSARTARALASEVLALQKPGDIVVLSIHWGSNWGYEIPPEQRAFARRMIDLGACDLLHGHSSHHARPMEIYKGKLVLYGCGDFINDYEGVGGHDAYRGDLAPMYLPEVDEAGLTSLKIILFERHRFRLRRAALGDVRWFKSVLNSHGEEMGARLEMDEDQDLRLSLQDHRHL